MGAKTCVRPASPFKYDLCVARRLWTLIPNDWPARLLQFHFKCVRVSVMNVEQASISSWVTGLGVCVVLNLQMG